jgi:hypothetical protein
MDILSSWCKVFGAVVVGALIKGSRMVERYKIQAQCLLLLSCAMDLRLMQLHQKELAKLVVEATLQLNNNVAKDGGGVQVYTGGAANNLRRSNRSKSSASGASDNTSGKDSYNTMTSATSSRKPPPRAPRSHSKKLTAKSVTTTPVKKVARPLDGAATIRPGHYASAGSTIGVLNLETRASTGDITAPATTDGITVATAIQLQESDEKSNISHASIGDLSPQSKDSTGIVAPYPQFKHNWMVNVLHSSFLRCKTLMKSLPQSQLHCYE